MRLRADRLGWAIFGALGATIILVTSGVIGAGPLDPRRPIEENPTVSKKSGPIQPGTIRAFWSTHQRLICRSLGSNRSLSQSPKKLNDMTTKKIANPGKNAIHHAVLM